MCKKKAIKFVIDKNRYYNEFHTDYLELGINPKYIVQTALELPYHLPLSDENCGIFHFIVEDDIIGLIFYSKNSRKSYSFGLEDTTTRIPVKRSFVEMNYIFDNKKTLELNNDELTSIFDKMLHTLNEVVLAYYISQQDINAYLLNKEILDPICYFKTIEIDGWKEEVILFIIHSKFDISTSTPKLSGQELNGVMNHLQIIKQNANPFILFRIFYLDAKRNLYNGNSKDSVVCIQTSIECLIKTFIGEVLRFNGETEENIEEKLGENLKYLIRNELKKFLEGSWDYNEKDTPIGIWNKECYDIRNQIVHRGHIPTLIEAKRALKAGIDFQNYIINQIKDQIDRYPTLKHFFIFSP